jgi:cytidylate kinase
MYRALAWSIARAGLAPDDTPALRRHVDRVQIDVEGDRVVVDERDVTDEIRSPEIATLTSRLSMLGVVRDKLTPIQRRLAATGGVVLEGRDTGTVVCPDAEVKFYLDAALEERARRRQAELRARGVELPPDAARDTQDSSRELAPLKKAPDAVEVDSTGLSVEQVVAIMADTVERRRRCG